MKNLLQKASFEPILHLPFQLKLKPGMHQNTIENLQLIHHWLLLTIKMLLCVAFKLQLSLCLKHLFECENRYVWVAVLLDMPKVKYFFFYFIIKTIQQSTILSWVEHLQNMFSNHTGACSWFLLLLLTERRGWFRFLLLECDEEYIRSLFAKLLYTCLKTLAPCEYPFYFDTGKYHYEPILFSH